MELFKNLYRIGSARLQGWEYSSPGYYFVTICVKNQLCLFGDIKNGTMALNPNGIIASTGVQKIEQHFDRVEVVEFIVMPNHVHMIVHIQSHLPMKSDTTPQISGTGDMSTPVSITMTPEDASYIRALQGGATGKHNPMVHLSLSSIVRWYKARVTIEIHQTVPGFAWQSRFYDRVIRDQDELQCLRLYLIQNPSRWEDTHMDADMRGYKNDETR